jgi:hypothetical protein
MLRQSNIEVAVPTSSFKMNIMADDDFLIMQRQEFDEEDETARSREEPFPLTMESFWSRFFQENDDTPVSMSEKSEMRNASCFKIRMSEMREKPQLSEIYNRIKVNNHMLFYVYRFFLATLYGFSPSFMYKLFLEQQKGMPSNASDYDKAIKAMVESEFIKNLTSESLESDELVLFFYLDKLKIENQNLKNIADEVKKFATECGSQREKRQKVTSTNRKMTMISK